VKEREKEKKKVGRLTLTGGGEMGNRSMFQLHSRSRKFEKSDAIQKKKKKREKWGALAV